MWFCTCLFCCRTPPPNTNPSHSNHPRPRSFSSLFFLAFLASFFVRFFSCMFVTAFNGCVSVQCQGGDKDGSCLPTLFTQHTSTFFRRFFSFFLRRFRSFSLSSELEEEEELLELLSLWSRRRSVFVPIRNLNGCIYDGIHLSTHTCPLQHVHALLLFFFLSLASLASPRPPV